MKGTIPLFVIIAAILVAFLTLFGDSGLPYLRSQRRSLAVQEESNRELRDYVESLRSSVYGLRESDRALEKAARNELGMARPNEEIFFFERVDQNRVDAAHLVDQGNQKSAVNGHR